jgi:hypothetical protein
MPKPRGGLCDGHHTPVDSDAAPVAGFEGLPVAPWGRGGGSKRRTCGTPSSATRLIDGRTMEARGCEQLILLPSPSPWRGRPCFRCRRVLSGCAGKTASDRCVTETACTAIATSRSAGVRVTAMWLSRSAVAYESRGSRSEGLVPASASSLIGNCRPRPKMGGAFPLRVAEQRVGVDGLSAARSARSGERLRALGLCRLVPPFKKSTRVGEAARCWRQERAAVGPDSR